MELTSLTGFTPTLEDRQMITEVKQNRGQLYVAVGLLALSYFAQEYTSHANLMYLSSFGGFAAGSTLFVASSISLYNSTNKILKSQAPVWLYLYSCV